VRAVRSVLIVAVAVAACGRKAGIGGGGDDVLAEAHALADEGRLDEALQRAQEAPKGAASLYEQGRIWSLKARQAPLPTAAAAAGGPPGAPLPPPPEFKEEELRAADFFEQAMAAQPEESPAAIALAELLAPHAARRHQREAEAARRPRGKGAPPGVTETAGLDWSVDRVLRLYQQGLKADAAPRAAAESFIAFALRIDRLDAAEAGYQELTRRVKESAEPYRLYGDFLLEKKKDSAGAIEQYRQALIWKPDDQSTRSRIAEIYLGRADAYYRQQQYSLVEGQLSEAAKYIQSGSPQEAQLRDQQDRLHRIRR
jgi:hypothetical protein